MKHFIFITTQGFTQTPNGNDIENCQVLGRSRGDSKHEALQSLLDDNSWIESGGYDVEEIIGYEITIK